MSRVIPGCRAVAMVHKKGPSSLRVDFYFPSEGQRVVVIIRHGEYGGLSLHSVHVGRLSSTETYYIGDGRSEDSSS